VYGIDSVHGANYVYGATLFPQQISTGGRLPAHVPGAEPRKTDGQRQRLGAGIP